MNNVQNNNNNQINNNNNNYNYNYNNIQMNNAQNDFNNNNQKQINDAQNNINNNNNQMNNVQNNNNNQINNNNLINNNNNYNNIQMNNAQNDFNNNIQKQMNDVQNNVNNNNQMNNVENNNNNQINNIQNNNINQINQNNLDERREISAINARINDLIRENTELRDQLKSLKEDFELYKKTMNLSCFYNQFDINAFQLDNIFNNREFKEIIKTSDEFAFLNRGIRHLFNKNIEGFQGIYRSSNDEFELSQFKATLDEMEYFVLLISLADNAYKRRFGIFCSKNKLKKPIQINKIDEDDKVMGMNMGNNMMNNMENSMMNNMENSMMNNMGNNMMNMGMNMGRMNPPDNISENETIFDSNLYLTRCFLFSLDDLKIYYKENILNIAPNFILKYNQQYQRLLGFEGGEEILQNQPSPDFIMYKLSGKHEFKVKALELFLIKV